MSSYYLIRKKENDFHLEKKLTLKYGGCVFSHK